MTDAPTSDMKPVTEREVTSADEVLVTPCPRCGTEVDRTIPAGTLVSLLPMLRGFQLICVECSRADDEAEALRERERLRKLREEGCGLPAMLRGLTWESYDVGREGAGNALALARAWAAGESSKRGVFLVGAYGVGKTRLAATACWAMLDRRPCRFVNVAELIVRMTAAFGDAERSDALRVLTGTGALILDDLDKVKPSLTVLAHLYTAIDGRVAAGAPMFVTSNLSLNQLREHLSRPGKGEDPDEKRVAAEAIVSRLVGHCQAQGIRGVDERSR